MAEEGAVERTREDVHAACATLASIPIDFAARQTSGASQPALPCVNSNRELAFRKPTGEDPKLYFYEEEKIILNTNTNIHSRLFLG